MKHYLPLLLLFMVCLFGCRKQQPQASTALDKHSIEKANLLVKKYHAGEATANNVVKVVYFHGNDQEQLPNWRERLTRTLDDVSAFYKEEFKRYGIKIDGVPFEKAGGNYVFRVVQGNSKSRDYQISSGFKIQREIAAKTAGQINFEEDYVLIINALSFKREDGVYEFHSPYFGNWGKNFADRGLCQVADCELLDPRLQQDSTQRMIFSEMLVARKESSIAEFNSWYIGGIAHEMGHMFGLQHDFGHPSELSDKTISLMGEFGSRHFRDYRWGGKKSAVFSKAGILQLLSHPVFTQSNKNRYKEADINLTNLSFAKNGSEIVVNTSIMASERPYALTALTRSLHQTEYFNQSTSTFVSPVGDIQISLGQKPKGVYSLQLLYILPSGAARIFNKSFEVDNEGNAEVFEPANGTVVVQNFYNKLLNHPKTPVNELKLGVLQDILHPHAPEDAASYSGATLSLSDAKWEKATVGWEKVARNYFTTEREHTFFLENLGKIYRKGLYAHSPSSYVFNLNGKWKKFSAKVGLRDYAHAEGSAKFMVLGDGKVLFESIPLRTSQQASITLDITNIHTLELKADGTEGHNSNSWAVWLDPIIER